MHGNTGGTKSRRECHCRGKPRRSHGAPEAGSESSKEFVIRQTRRGEVERHDKIAHAEGRIGQNQCQGENHKQGASEEQITKVVMSQHLLGAFPARLLSAYRR
ncbi:MAG: hypothetical protein JNM54_16075 [Candidatus Accumulibacter sp.]|uniref:hypothetical protein n=1 Tax=Accumulibacter sp. TaxID=2053492 RepID=UPI001A3DEEF4|nr:hypothetical protein [Accumulibacter sp.]MBL8369414.1 hypothetical protein [Accumulibacter sp.]MBN8515265.1 hypothetical protein [Accumulibacter sp.]MBO3701320.1 hypothetical protein [Accumulibacter sp.]